jgi:hypothetical protein
MARVWPGEQPLLKRRPLLAGQARSEKVVDDPGRAFLAMNGPRNRCQHSRTAWPLA